jgi:hypothetical protein
VDLSISKLCADMWRKGMQGDDEEALQAAHAGINTATYTGWPAVLPCYMIAGWLCRPQSTILEIRSVKVRQTLPIPGSVSHILLKPIHPVLQAVHCCFSCTLLAIQAYMHPFTL